MNFKMIISTKKPPIKWKVLISFIIRSFYNPNILANKSGKTPRMIIKAITTTAMML